MCGGGKVAGGKRGNAKFHKAGSSFNPKGKDVFGRGGGPLRVKKKKEGEKITRRQASSAPKGGFFLGRGKKEGGGIFSGGRKDPFGKKEEPCSDFVWCVWCVFGGRKRTNGVYKEPLTSTRGKRRPSPYVWKKKGGGGERCRRGNCKMGGGRPSNPEKVNLPYVKRGPAPKGGGKGHTCFLRKRGVFPSRKGEVEYWDGKKEGGQRFETCHQREGPSKNNSGVS